MKYSEMNNNGKALFGFGWIVIVDGAFALILSILGVTVMKDLPQMTAMDLVITIIVSLFNIAVGVFSVRAAKDNTKINTAYILALINMILVVLGCVISLIGNRFTASDAFSAGIAVVLFWGAYNVKKFGGSIKKSGGTAVQ